MNKLKLDVLLRWDACTAEQRKNAGEHAKLSKILSRAENPVFDLKHEVWRPLDNFVRQIASKS